MQFAKAERAIKHEIIRDFVDLPCLCTCGFTPEHVNAGMKLEDYTAEVTRKFEEHFASTRS